MKRHGWNTHGTPCCELAPLAERPDHVTACGGGYPAAGGLGCATCWMDRIRAHVEVQMPREFLYAPGSMYAGEPAWRRDSRLMAWQYAPVIDPSITVITNGY